VDVSLCGQGRIKIQSHFALKAAYLKLQKTDTKSFAPTPGALEISLSK
jgi:hypothetical protein